jgi:hypothetical protein
VSEEEYLRYVNELLVSLGGSWHTPSGQDKDGLYFSFLRKPIKILLPHLLNAQQRALVVEMLAEQFAFPYYPDR